MRDWIIVIATVVIAVSAVVQATVYYQDRATAFEAALMAKRLDALDGAITSLKTACLAQYALSKDLVKTNAVTDGRNNARNNAARTAVVQSHFARIELDNASARLLFLFGPEVEGRFREGREKVTKLGFENNDPGNTIAICGNHLHYFAIASSIYSKLDPLSKQLEARLKSKP